MSNNYLKVHEVVTKMTKVEKGGGGTVNMWSLNQKISGLVFVESNIPAQKYGRNMEIRQQALSLNLSSGNIRTSN